jgi:hypothetical protein
VLPAISAIRGMQLTGTCLQHTTINNSHSAQGLVAMVAGHADSLDAVQQLLQQKGRSCRSCEVMCMLRSHVGAGPAQQAAPNSSYMCAARMAMLSSSEPHYC